MRNMFIHPKKNLPSPPTVSIQQSLASHDSHSAAPDLELRSHQLRYLSDDSDLEGSESDISDDEITTSAPTSSTRLPAVPAFKRRKLDVPLHELRRLRQEQHLEELKGALAAIEKLLKSKKTAFIGGPNGLQAKRARSIQSYLMMVVKKGRLSIDASKRAAESHGFTAEWGGRQVRCWTRLWVSERKLPESLQGRHAKVYSLLSDPAIAAELRAYVRSNKWAINPEKLVQFSQNKLIPAEADKYLKHIIDEEMPLGLKRYMELEIFPRIHLKVGHGISLNTARRWLRQEGFRYLKHRKGLYFDGHDRPDVVDYRQNHFILMMKSYEHRFVRYVVGDVDTEVVAHPHNFVERRLVLCAHDEMTAQANDAVDQYWVFEDEFRLRKKGAGRGLHRSDVICSTVGHLVDAGESLEYGKNYDGYWRGENFCTQVCKIVFVLQLGVECRSDSPYTQLKEKIIPAFEQAHGPGYQALFLIDNSQGHAAYAEDALLVSRMNINPGGKQARMRNGWFISNGIRIEQEMMFSTNHPEHPGEPKGIKTILMERGLYQVSLRSKCKGKCESHATNCCNKRILELQPDFKEQKSLVQEIIDSAGHLCIFLPKFHCELNFIEFFWGRVKKYLRDHCDCTFETLKENMPRALASVELRSIHLWEHRTHRWINAYQSGLGTKDAQLKVQQFSSTKYKSHRRVPETVAQLFD